jgi:hypothetical protein
MGWLLGHDYEAIFDEAPPDNAGEQMARMGHVPSWDMAGVIESMKKTVYQGHVCVRCGNRVRRVERI